MMPTTTAPHLTVIPHDAVPAWEIGSRITCKFASPDYCILEVVLPPGNGSPMHRHRREDELLYVVSGECEIRDLETTTILQAGGTAILPKGAAHAFRNSGDTDSTVLITAIPGGLEKSFAEIAALVAQDAISAEAFDDINTRYEVEIIPEA